MWRVFSAGTERKRHRETAVIGCLTFLMLIAFVCCPVCNQTGIRALSDCAYAELESGAIYQAGDLKIASRLAANIQEVGDTADSVTDCYLAFFHDRNGCLVAAVLSVDDNDDIYARLSDVTASEEQAAGACFVNGRVKIGDRVSTLGSEGMKAYDRALAVNAVSLDECFVSLEYVLVYDCNGYSDPLIQFLENRHDTKPQ